jgi:hypothetical protein
MKGSRVRSIGWAAEMWFVRFLVVLVTGACLSALPALGGEPGVCCQCDECNAAPGLCFLAAPSDDDCDTLCQNSTTCQFSSTSTPGTCTSSPECETSVVCCQCDECNADPGLCFLEAPSDPDCDSFCQDMASCPFSSDSTPGVCVRGPSCGASPGGAAAPVLSTEVLLILAAALVVVGIFAQRRRPHLSA